MYLLIGSIGDWIKGNFRRFVNSKCINTKYSDQRTEWNNVVKSHAAVILLALTRLGKHNRGVRFIAVMYAQTNNTRSQNIFQMIF